MSVITIAKAASKFNIKSRTLYNYVYSGLIEQVKYDDIEIDQIMVREEDVAKIAKNPPRRGRPISKINGSR